MNPDPSCEVTQTASDLDATIRVDVRATLPPGLEQPGDMIGRYKLLELLGEGGFGSVWRAEQFEPIHREVALKVIKAGMDSKEIIARFAAERQALAMMDHPNIAAVLDAGTTESGRPFFAMELVKGVPLTEFCDARKLTIRERLELFIPVCQAVQHAHQKAILHRDLKPSNILVVEVDGKAVPKVIDFGIAKALGGAEEQAFQASLARTQAGMIIGTPQYMSPEQAGAEPDLDTRSDIYTLGVILYELLVGDTPLGREQMRKAAMDEIMRLVRDADAKRPSSRLLPVTEAAQTAAQLRQSDTKRLSHTLRGDLDWIVLKALEKDRNRRYETANALALDLQRHLHDEPVSAGPPSAGYRLKKLVRRNKVVFATAAAVVLALAAGLMMALRGEARAESMLTRMQLQRAEELLESNDASGGLAYLAAVLRRHPDDKITAARLLSALRDRSHAQLIAGPWQGKQAQVVRWEPSGDAVHVLSDGQLLRWRLSDPRPGPVPLLDTAGEPISDPPTYSPDGNMVLCFHGWSRCRLYALKTGKALTGMLEKQEGWDGLGGHESAGPVAEFSPDGRMAAVVWTSNHLYVWNTSTGELIKKLAGDPTYVDFHPDGKSLALGLRNGSVQLWDISRPDWQMRQHIAISKSFIRRVQFLYEGTQDRLLVHAGSFVGLYGLKNGGLTGDTSFNGVACIDVLPSSGIIVIGQIDHQVRVVSQSTSRAGNELTDAGGYLNSIGLSPDGLRVLVQTKNMLQVRSVEDGTLLSSTRALPSSTLSDRFNRPAAVMNADGTAVAVAQNEGTLSIWRTGLSSSLPVLYPMRGSQTICDLHPDGDLLATSNKSGRQAAVWDLSSGRQLSPSLLAAGWNCNVEALAFQPGTDLLWIGVDRLVQQRPKGTSLDLAVPWDWRTGRRDGPGLASVAEEAFVWGLKFSKDGARLEVSRSGKSEPIYDARSGTPISGPWNIPDKMWFSHLAESGNSFLQLSMNGVRRWNLVTGKADSPLFGGRPRLHHLSMQRLTTSPECEACVILGDDNSARVWDCLKGVPMGPQVSHLDEIQSSSLQIGADLLATSSDDGSAHIWRISTGQSVGAPIRHRESIYSIQFSQDGSRLSTASYDGNARLWHVPSARPLTEPLKVFGQYPSDARWHPDGRRLITSGRSAVQCWDVPSVGSAVPGWLPDWAEAVGGFRLDHEGQPSPLGLKVDLHLQKLSAENRGEDIFSRTIRWFYQQTENRTISPEASVSLLEWAAAVSSVGDRQKNTWALAVAPGSPHAWLARWWEGNHMQPARYPEDPGSWRAFCWQGADESVMSPPPMRAHWRPVFSRIASSEPVQKRYPAHGLLLRAALTHETNPAEAATLCRDALEAGLDPVWQSRARIMLSKLMIHKLGRADEAARLLGGALGAISTADKDQINDERQEQMILRRTALLRTGDAGAMAADNAALLDLPRRNATAPAGCLDLTPFYTQRLEERIWGPQFTPGNFGEMPSALQTFAGVTFDVRGLILMRCRENDLTLPDGFVHRADPGQPRQITGIRVDAACHKLHFLHTGIETGYVPKGRLEIGSYLVRYEDGTELTIPVRRSHELADHQRFGDKHLEGRLPPPPKLHQIAWQGQDEWSRRALPGVFRHTCVYLFTWTNPKPEARIKSLEIKSDVIGGSFAVFAITRE